MTQRVPGRLRPRIFLTFGTTRVVDRQPYALAAFTPGKTPGTHLQGLSWPQSTWFRRGDSRKKSQVTPPGIDPGTSQLVAKCLNHYATPGPQSQIVLNTNWVKKKRLYWRPRWNKKRSKQRKRRTTAGTIQKIQGWQWKWNSEDGEEGYCLVKNCWATRNEKRRWRKFETESTFLHKLHKK